MKAEILKTKKGIGLTIILLLGVLIGLNLYNISPENATKIIIKELHKGCEVFEIKEDQKQLINQVIFGVEEYDLPSLVMKFNKSVEVRSGLSQVLDIERIEVSSSKEDVERVAVRVNLKETIGADGTPLANERTYTGLIMLTLKKINMREWRIENVETIPFRNTSI